MFKALIASIRSAYAKSKAVVVQIVGPWKPRK